MYDEYLLDLKALQQGLPERFRPTLDYLTSRPPGLFNSSWPLVPNHTDLLENNIHVIRERAALRASATGKTPILVLSAYHLGVSRPCSAF